MTLIERAKLLAGGVETLTSWLAGGSEIVDAETAQRRTDICLKCGLNRPGGIVSESVAKAIKKQVEFKNSMGLQTDGDESLKTCHGCMCYLPLKIFVPLERILPHDDERKNFDPKCWLLNEAP